MYKSIFFYILKEIFKYFSSIYFKINWDVCAHQISLVE